MSTLVIGNPAGTELPNGVQGIALGTRTQYSEAIVVRHEVAQREKPARGNGRGDGRVENGEAAKGAGAFAAVITLDCGSDRISFHEMPVRPMKPTGCRCASGL